MRAEAVAAALGTVKKGSVSEMTGENNERLVSISRGRQEVCQELSVWMLVMGEDSGGRNEFFTGMLVTKTVNWVVPRGRYSTKEAVGAPGDIGRASGVGPCPTFPIN